MLSALRPEVFSKNKWENEAFVIKMRVLTAHPASWVRSADLSHNPLQCILGVVCHCARVKNSSQNNIFINLRQHWRIPETRKRFSLPGMPPPGLGSNTCVMQCHNSTSSAVMWCSKSTRWQANLEEPPGLYQYICQLKGDSYQSVSACSSWTVQIMERK